MDARETAVSFSVDLGSRPSTAGQTPAVAVAGLLVERLAAQGVECTEPVPFESGARFRGRVGRRDLPMLVGPAPAPTEAGRGRWFLSIGSSLMPLARLIGAKDDRDHARELVTAALDAAPELDDVRWHDAESWSARAPRRRRRT